MHRIVVRLAPWIVLALMGGPTALAQEPPPPLPAEPAAEPMPAPETAAVEPIAKGDDAPVEAPPPEEEASGITGWFRIDSDGGGLQLWAGAAHPLTDNLSLATDIYVYAGADAQSYGEFDIGPAIALGPVILTPMIGFQINFTAQRAAAVVPQLYTIIDAGPIYFESWIQVYLYDMFAADDTTALDFLHTRNFLLFKASDYLALGAEIDANFALTNKEEFAAGETVYWLPVGPHIKLNYGEASTLELFVGYDLAADDQGKDDLAGRFTFVQTW
jgi:hypothetical protein